MQNKITYESIINKKDIEFIVTQKVFMDPILWISRLVFALGGIGLMLFSLFGYMKDKVNLPLALVLGIIGFYLLIIDPFLNHKIKVNAQFKNKMNRFPHYIEVDNDSIDMVIKDNSRKPLTYRYKLKRIDVAFEKNNNIYMHLANSKMFFVFHNDEFISGNIDELKKILNSKNIKLISK